MVSLDFSKSADGLIPAIVQDHTTNEVLMLAYIKSAGLGRNTEDR